MKNNYNIRQAKDVDLHNIMLIYNSYIKESFAAYSEENIGIDFIINLKREAISFYVIEIDQKIVGFCVLKNYLPYVNFKHTGVLTYFILSEFTRKGYGTFLFNKLVLDAKNNGINTIYVHLSSLNESSFNFHKKHGFIECARFDDIAKKFNKSFDLIWMKKHLK